MPKNKKTKKQGIQTFTARHTERLVNNAYDHLEKIAIATAERTLKEQFGFGDTRLQRFRATYTSIFGEEAAKYASQVNNQLRGRN